MLPVHKSTQPRFRRWPAALLVLAALVPALPTSPASATPATPAGVTIDEVTFAGADGAVLSGAVVAPATPPTGSAGAVIVHDAGPRDWQEYRRIAEDFALAGIVTLVYDKRTTGYSMMHRDFGLLADDALAAVAVLRSRPGVDPTRVGLVGFSEGGWVAPLAAARSSDVAYLATVGGSGLTPARTQAWSYGAWLTHAGVAGSMRRTVQVTGTRLMVAAGMFPAADHDPVPVLRQVRQPVLAVWGALDRQVPPHESAQIFHDALTGGGNSHITIRLLAAAEHSLLGTDDGGFTPRDDYAPGYPQLLTSWIDGLAAGPPAASVDPLRAQQAASVPLPGRRWWQSIPAQLAAIATIMLILVLFPLVAALRRRSGEVARWPARLLPATALAAILGFVCYLGFMASNGTQQIGPVVAGRSVVWVVLQLLALAAVAATVAVAVAWHRARSLVTGWRRVHLGALTLAGALFVPWGLYWGLLIP